MNELQIFNNEEFGEIRTVEIEGKPYFVAADIANSLGYSNTRDAISRHCKGVVKCDIPTSSGIQNMSVIPEGDIYRLIIRSQLPAAERFESWVFDEVIPSIRKTGGYHLPQTYSEALRALADQAEQMEKLAIENKDMKPKAEYFDTLVDRNLLTNFRDTAKELGIKPKKFVTFLMEHGFIYRDQFGSIRPYAKKNNGLFELKEFNSISSDYSGLQTLITPKGRETFRLLISN